MLEVYRLNIKELLGEQYKEVFLKQVSKEKRERIRRFRREIDGQRTLLGEILIKTMLSKHLRRPMKEIIFKENEYGKPYLEGNPLYFNLSHSGEWVVGVISEAPVGIDVEEIKKADLGIAERFFTKKEYHWLQQIENHEIRHKMFYTLWSGKESYIKMIGKGLTIPLDEFELMYTEENLQLKVPYEEKQANFKVYPIENYSLVVCYTGEASDIVYKEIDYDMLYDYLC